MKHLIIICLVLASLTACSQGMKPNALVPATTTAPATPGEDTLKLTGVFRSDTTRAIATIYIEGGTLGWTRAYLVARYFLSRGEQPRLLGQTLYTDRWVVLRPEDVADVRSAPGSAKTWK